MYVPLVSWVVWGLRVVSTIMPRHYDSFTKRPNNTKKATQLSLWVSLQHVGIPSWSWHSHRCLTSLAKGIHLCVVGTAKAGGPHVFPQINLNHGKFLNKLLIN